MMQGVELYDKNRYWNKYPVIRIDLEDIDVLISDKFEKKFYDKIKKLYIDFKSVITKEGLESSDVDAYHNILSNRITEEIATDSWRFLTELLSKLYAINPIVLIDEYDMPLEKAYARGYYNKAVSLVGGFLSSALKGNKYLR